MKRRNTVDPPCLTIPLETWNLYMNDLEDHEHTCEEFLQIPEEFIEGEEVDCDVCGISGHTFRKGVSSTLTIIWDDE